MIPLYSLYTPSHRPLKERFFEPSVPNDLELRLHYFDSPGHGEICSPSFCRAIIRKVEVILLAIEENWGRPFVWSDIDAQFFRPFSEWVLRLTERYDIGFQVDAPGPVLCSGFFFCKGGEAVRALWQEALAYVKRPELDREEQPCVRDRVGSIPGLKAGYLPLTFMGGGTFTGSLWTPGMDLPIPEGLIAHHANFTIGVANKMAQCDYVRRNYLTRPRRVPEEDQRDRQRAERLEF